MINNKQIEAFEKTLDTSFAEWLRHQYVDNHKSVYDIAEIIYGRRTCKTIISRQLKKHGIPTRDAHEHVRRTGEAHPAYKHGLTDTLQLQRNSRNYKAFRQGVFERDGYKCQLCLSKKELNAHHANSFHWCVSRRFDITNGVTLCRKCHMDFHKSYGRKFNTIAQYIHFALIRAMELMRAQGVKTNE